MHDYITKRVIQKGINNIARLFRMSIKQLMLLKLSDKLTYLLVL